MRKNMYNSLDEFIYEYEVGFRFSTETSLCRYRGLEFIYNDVYYRLCREPRYVGYDKEEWRPVLPDGRQGVYDVMIFHKDSTGQPSCDCMEVIGWYSDIYDVLDNCIIQGRKFRDVIMDDSLEVVGQD